MAKLTTTAKKLDKRLMSGGYSSPGFTEAEIADCPEALRLIFIELANVRFRGAPRLAANAMCGAAALILAKRK